MNFKTIYLLFGLLVAMLAVLGVVLYLGPSPPGGEGYVFPAFKEKEKKTDNITKVVIQRKRPADSDIVFERDDKDWKMTSPRTLPTESGVVSRMIEAIANARVDEQNKPKSLKEAGLDAPARIVTLTGDGIDLTLTIGEVVSGEDGDVVYVLSSAQPKTPLAMHKSDVASALEGVNYFRAKNLLGDTSTDIRDVTLSAGKKGPVEFHKQKDSWRMVKPPYGEADITSLLTAIPSLTVNYSSEKDNDFVKDGVTDLAKYNLDANKAEVLRIEVTHGEGSKAKKATLLVGISKKIDKEDKYYAALDEGKTKDVVKVSATSLEPFIKVLDDPGALRNKNLVQLDNFKTPDAIDVKNSYKLLEFRKPDTAKSWELYRGTIATAVDENEIRQLIDALKKKDQVVSFPDPKRRKELGLDKPADDLDVVKVYADSLEKPEVKKPNKKADKGEKVESKTGKPPFKKGTEPVAVLKFGNREGDNVAVERIWGKDSTIVMVPSALLDQVRKGPKAYIEKVLPSFNPVSSEENVTSVVLQREGETYEMTREKPTDPWKLVKPAALKGRLASDQTVRDILTEMNKLMAREVESEKASPDDLKNKDGLTDPKYKVVITLTKDKKSTTHEYDFGKEVPGRGVYAKVAGKDTIYLVGPEVLNNLKREVRDTTVFNFPPVDVTAVKLTGWSEAFAGTPTSITLEKKDDTWTVAANSSVKPKPFDPAKVPSLLGNLSHLSAEKFVKSGKGLKLSEDALQIEITLKDKKVLELTLGGLDGSSYSATSNQLKDDVFLIPKDLFEEVRKGPSYFRKK